MATWNTLSGAYTRAAETLTVPKAAVFDDAMGTFECWVKPLRDAGTNAQYIFDGGGAANKSLICYIHTDGTLRLIYGTGTADVTLTGTTVLTEQIWHSVAFKWGLGGASLYVNGVLEDSDTTVPGLTLGANIYLGSKTDGTLQLDGLIDDICISEIALNTLSNALQTYDGETTYLLDCDDELITPLPILAGATIEEAIFNYVSCTKALESLAEKSNYVWYINFKKRLKFFPRETYAAAWVASGSDMKYGTVEVISRNPSYRNTQFVKGGRDLTDALTETRIGDSNTRAWTLSFPAGKEPTITVDDTPATVGIRGLETGKDFYWTKGDKVVSQDTGAAVLTAANHIDITYQGWFDVVVKTLSEAEILSRLTAEGTTGIVEDVADEPNSTTRDAAFEIANAKLAKYGELGRTVKFRTHRSGLSAGQILTVLLTDHNLSNIEMLIESVQISTEEDNIWYDISCVEGVSGGSWTNFFKQIAQRGESYTIKENIKDDEVLITLKAFTKNWLVGDTNNIFTELYPLDNLYPSATLYPCFEVSKRVLYMELLTSADVVLLRKAITVQSGTTSLNSLVYVQPYEGLGTIAKVRWYGGDTATLTNGTGVLVDEQAWVEVKTGSEALEVDKTDIKW